MNRVRKVRGITLLEMMFVLAIIAILSTNLVPNFRRLIIVYEQKSIATAMESFIQQQRQSAINAHSPIYVSINPEEKCLGAAKTPKCNCNELGNCLINDVESVFSFSSDHITLNTLTLASEEQFRFDSLLGVSAGYNGSFTIASEYSHIKLVISALGRSRLCSESGTILGIRSC